MTALAAGPSRVLHLHGVEPGRKATWLELFFDLAFVAAVAQVGAPLAGEYSLSGLLRYAVLFLLIWWAWSGHTHFSTRFGAEDTVQRVLTLAQIFVVAVMAVNAKDALDSRSSAGFAAAYAVMRLLLVAQYWRARTIAVSRHFTSAHAAGCGMAAALWLVSALVPAPWRFWLWAVALVVDLGTPIVTARLTVDVPPHPEHLPERFGLFTIILLGESMVSVMKGMESQQGWSVSAASSAFIGIAVAFLAWWWYFDGAEGAAERPVRSRQQARRFLVWSFAHLPLYLGIAITGVGIEHIIRIAPDGRLHQSETWMLCAATASWMTALVTIGAVADRFDRTGTRPQLALQYTIAAVPMAGGLLGEHVAPVLLVAAIACLCLLQLVLALRPRREPASQRPLRSAPQSA